MRCGLWRRALARRRIDHELKGLLCRGQLGDVVLGVCAADVLLHGAVALLLKRKGLIRCSGKGIESWKAASAETGIA